MSGMFEGIPGSNRWTSIEPVPKGWSRDTKYRVETTGGDKQLVRISDIGEYPRKKLEYDALRKLDGLPILMTRPVSFGTFNDGADGADGARVFTITTWIDGVDAEGALPRLSPREQYDLGYAAGRILRQIHQVPAPEGQPDWAERFNRKIDRNIRNYEACGIEVPGADVMIRHIGSLRHLLEGRPQVFQHGDYHCGNMIITDGGQIGIIDFNRLDYGDPWEEFNRVVWCAAVSGPFASGRINGYFEASGKSVGGPENGLESGCESHSLGSPEGRCGLSQRYPQGVSEDGCTVGVDPRSRTDPEGYSQEVLVHDSLDRCEGDSRGAVRGKGKDHVPHEFFQLMSLYIASNMLSSVPWAIPFGQAEIDTMIDQARSILDWYDGFRSFIPRWYVSESPEGPRGRASSASHDEG